LNVARPWLYENTLEDAYALFAVVFFGYDPTPRLSPDTDGRGGGENETPVKRHGPLPMIDYGST
jgi:hypothetical protein